MRRTVRLTGAVLVVVLATILAACGLPKDDAPREIAADKVPFDLLGPSTTTPSTATAGSTIVKLYFVDGAKLRAINRTTTSREPRLVLDALIKGVTDTDPLGIGTAIPTGTRVLDTVFDGDTLVVTLSNEMLSVASTEQKNAFAQLVFTVTDLGISGVRFRVADANGSNPQDVQPPTDQGTHGGPLTRADYFTLVSG